MDVIINETGEKKTLGIEDPKTGLDYTMDFIGNAGGFIYGDFTPTSMDGYSCTQETYDWWYNVMKVHEYAAKLMAKLRKEIDDLEAIDGMEEIMQYVMSAELDYFESKDQLERWFARTIDMYNVKIKRFDDGSYFFEKGNR
jgi:hypothetical protein